MTSVNPHQYPRAGEVFLDHVGIFVPEFQHSGAAMERLGFTLTPLRVHTSALAPGQPMAPLGTGNRSAMFRVGYLELLGATADTPMADQLRRALQRHAGLHLVAFTGQDPHGHHAALAADGLAPAPVATIERTQATPQGEMLVSASIVRLAPDAWPEGRVQMVFPHMSADAVWHADLVLHANAADRLDALLVVVQDAEQRARQFSRFARRPLHRAGRRWVLELDRGRIHFIAPQDAPRYLPGQAIPALPFIAAVAVGSRDLAQTRALLQARAIVHAAHGGTLQVDAREALGATLVFHDLPDGDPFDRLDTTIPTP